MKPTLAITTGDPYGIGPEIVQRALNDPAIRKLGHFDILGDDFSGEKTINPKLAGQSSIKALEEAVRFLKEKKADVLITAPVSKTHLKAAGFKFPGQTEFLANIFDAKDEAMMLACSQLKIVLTTIHIPLKKVFEVLTPKLIEEKLTLTNNSLKKYFGIKNPRIAVCGLNPHAGEGGLFGNEEKKIIIPAIKKAVKKGINAIGPLSADTIFYRAIKGEFDAVLCHYHDQGLIPIKTLAFDEGVNTTLGLPIIRTSPDHGPAFDIAGKNKANPSSMKEAIKLACQMWENSQG